jgi:MFS family permease
MPASDSTPSSLWRNGPFLRLWSSSTISVLGDQVTFLALPWLVLQITHSPLQLGIVAALDMLPYTLFTLVAGVYIDRWDRRAVMLTADFVRFGTLASIPLAAAFDVLGMPQIYAVAFLAGSARVWYDLANYALLPSMVENSRLVEGNSKLEMSQGVSALLGPSLGGFLIKFLGAANAILADAFSFLISAAFLFSMAPHRAPRAPEERGWRAQLLAGLAYLFSRRILLESSLTTMALNLLFTSIQAVIVFYMQHELRLDAAATGTLFALAGVGPILVSVLAPRIMARLRLGQVIVASVFLVGILDAGLLVAPMLPIVPGFILAAVTQAAVFGLAILVRIALISYFQASIPGQLVARVNSATRLLSRLAIPIGALAGGIITQAFGVTWLIGFVCAGFVIEGIALLAFAELKRI